VVGQVVVARLDVGRVVVEGAGSAVVAGQAAGEEAECLAGALRTIATI